MKQRSSVAAVLVAIICLSGATAAKLRESVQQSEEVTRERFDMGAPL